MPAIQQGKTMIDLSRFSVWFVTGSQHLYGDEALEQVARNARQIVENLSQSDHIPISLVFKPVVTTPEAIHRLCQEANDDPACVGLVTWMHTFSPAKMWMAGLDALRKPFLHLHTQFNRDLPDAAAAWILAGGAHHTGFSQALTTEHLQDFAEIAGIEFLLIDGETTLPAFRKELRWNEAYYR